MNPPSSLKLKRPAQPNPEEKPNLPSSLKLKKPVKQPSQEDFMTDEDFERSIETANARIWNRIGETVLGAPGDIASFFTGLFGDEQQTIPTSRDIRSAGKKITGEALEPKTGMEEKIDEFVSDVASFSLPGTGQFKAIRNIGIPIIGGLMKEGLKYGNASEKTQAYGKVGTMVVLDLLSRRTGGAKKYAGSLFQQAEEALPKGVSFDASKLEKSLDTLEKTMTMGGTRPSTKKSLDKILEIKKEIKNGKIEGKRLAAYRSSINEAIDEIGGFNLEVPIKQKPAAIRNLNQVKSEVIKTLDEYGGKYNPEYQKLSRDANEAWAAYEKSNKIASFIQKKVPYASKSKSAGLLFSSTPVIGPAAAAILNPAGGVGLTAAALGYQSYKVLDRVVRSPVLRKYYINSLKEAAAGNVSQTTKNLKLLDKELDQGSEQ